MNKKALIGITLGLLVLTFLFLLIGFFAAGQIMQILALIFTVGTIVCVIIYLAGGASKS